MEEQLSKSERLEGGRSQHTVVRKEEGGESIIVGKEEGGAVTKIRKMEEGASKIR